MGKYITKREFEALKSGVVGKPAKDAQWPIKRYGYKTFLVPENCNAITMIARPQTIIVWQKDNVVTGIEMGDPTELDKE